MSLQVKRMLGPPSGSQIGRRRRSRETLPARPDRHGDHVLLQSLVITYSRIATGRQHIHETVLHDDLHRDVGIGLEESRNDLRQDEPGGAPRHVDPQRAGRPIAEIADGGDCRTNFVERGSKAIRQPAAGFRGMHAARIPVQQAHTQLCLKPSDRLADAGGRDIRPARCLAEPACPDDGQKG